jgi:hypothetical protein
MPELAAMDAENDRDIIRLWNRLRALQKQGQPTITALEDVRRALAEREARALRSRVAVPASRKTA